MLVSPPDGERKLCAQRGPLERRLGYMGRVVELSQSGKLSVACCRSAVRVPVWKSAVALQSEPALQWLRLRPRVAFWTGLALVLLLCFVILGPPVVVWRHHAALAPLLTVVAGVSVAAVALVRHFAQTDADRQRRITESFAKAVEQLGSDKLEVRLGGIYSLERRSEQNREREVAKKWRPDLRGAILKRADLRDAHLERADLMGAHLEEADLVGAHLERAFLVNAHLKGTRLFYASRGG